MYQLAFYIAKSGNWYDKWVARSTRGRFSHVELVIPQAIAEHFFSQESVIERNRRLRKQQQLPNLINAFSSSSRDGGTRFKQIDFGTKHWHLVQLPHLSFEDECKIVEWCFSESDCKYDWEAIGKFLLPRFFNCSDKKWICSEVMIYVLQKFYAEHYPRVAGICPCRVSPNRLYKLTVP